jgi:hypothetical protein
MQSKNGILITLACVALLVLGVVAYSRVASSSLNGIWLKKAGGPHLPDEIRVLVENGEFKVSFLVPYGIE